MNKKALALFGLYSIFLIFSLNTVFAQDFYRFKADYTIKIDNRKGKPIMKMGTVFYDKNQKKLVLKNGFPVKETLVYSDTVTYVLRVGKIFNQFTNLSPVEFSIFHLALNGNLSNYGLDKAGYSLEEVKRDKGLVIASWVPDNNFYGKLGKILIAVKDKELYSVLFLDLSEKIISKHIFHKYTNINGFVFPTEVVRIFYKDDEEFYEVSTYRNIKINETGNDEYYNIQIPQ